MLKSMTGCPASRIERTVSWSSAIPYEPSSDSTGLVRTIATLVVRAIHDRSYNRLVNYRLVYAGLGLALVAVVALGLAFGSAGGEPDPLPAPLEDLSPRPGDSVQRLHPIEVKMRPGYDLVLSIDGIRIPEAELVTVEATGVHAWQPGPGRLFEQWTRGEHTVRITWNTSAGLSDAGDYTWTFFSF